MLSLCSVFSRNSAAKTRASSGGNRGQEQSWVISTAECMSECAFLQNTIQQAIQLCLVSTSLGAKELILILTLVR